MEDGYYYDVRYLILHVIAVLKSYLAEQANNSTFATTFATKELVLVVIFGLSLMFLLTTIRIQLHCCSRFTFSRLIGLRLGLPAFSVPLTLSLIATLFLPFSSFWNAYIFIFVISFWSDAIHSYFTRFSGVEQHLLLQLVTQNLLYEEEIIQHTQGFSIEEVEDESSNIV